ncbi:MAG: RIP metalloprotease RseP [Saprospiraceae bacterium]|nr:RIP metalloprotease RseP [Saprospiraceae bacterium]
MDVLIKTAQLLLSLSILIVLHEMGHFAPARWFKTRVDKFYLFFDFAPFHSLWKTKKGETEYGIGWLPLGGYVKIAGMVDESMDTEFKNKPMEPWEFRAKPAWQRLIIMIGGVTVNFLLGILIFSGILWHWGEAIVPTNQIKYGLQMDSLLLRQGFRNGDMILKIGDQPFTELDPGKLIEAVVLNDVRNITILRDGREETLTMPADVAQQITSQKIPKAMLMQPRFPFIVDEVAPGKPAFGAGIQKGDHILALNGQPIVWFDAFAPVAQRYKSQEVTLTLLRGVDTISKQLTLTSDGLIGVKTKTEGYFKVERRPYSLAQAIPAGYQQSMDFLNSQLKAFGQMFKGKISAKDNLGSFISIGNLFPSSWDWETFWLMTARLSIILAFMNLLPIPALDGGHVVFLLWEVFTGRRVSDSVMEKAVTFGFFLLMGLMIYAFGLDIWRHIISRFF